VFQVSCDAAHACVCSDEVLNIDNCSIQIVFVFIYSGYQRL